MIPGNANPLLLASAADAAAAGPIKSLRFNDGDSAYLSRTPSSAGNQKTWTISFWVKRVKSGAYNPMIDARSPQNDSLVSLLFNSNDEFELGHYSFSSIKTSRKYRDFSSWYHIVLAVDTTQATASDRIKVYTNGVEETSFTTSTYPAQNTTYNWNTASLHTINQAGSNYGSQYLADIYAIDGSQLDPTSFGAYDDNGVWQAATYSGTYGTNGFHLLDFANESTIGADSSGNENDFTANNFVAVAGSGTTKTITTNGSISTSVSTEPFSGAGGAVGGGTTSDYVQVSASGHSDFSLDGVFTVEWWHYRSSSSTNTFMWTVGDSRTSSGLELYWGSTGSSLNLYTNDSGQTVTATSATGWKHYAVVRDSSNNIKVYYDGTLGLTYSNSNTFSGNITFGEFYGGSITGGLLGPISNFRLVKGSAVYTGNFTPPSSALSVISNTKLLTFQGSTIVDASGASAADVDVLRDVPTNGDQSDTGAGGEVSGNYAVMNALDNGGITLSNGNLDVTKSGSGWKSVRGTFGMSSGKWYWEYTRASGSGNQIVVGITGAAADLSTYLDYNSDGYGYNGNSGEKVNNNAGSSYGASFAAGDVVGIAFDADAGSLTFYKNGTSQGTAFTGLTSGPYFPAISIQSGDTGSLNFGQRAFAYSAPSNHKALCTTNLPTPTIADGSDYFDTLLWTGDGASSTREITGLSMENAPDWIWAKERNGGSSHATFDAVRGFGSNNVLKTNSSDAEAGSNGGFINSTSATSITFAQGTSSAEFYDLNNKTYVAWCWDAGSSTVSNTDGDVTSSVRANTTAGFSIVKWTNNGNNTPSDHQVGHGLGVVPDLVITKRLNNTGDWAVYSEVFNNPVRDELYLNTDGAIATAGVDLYHRDSTTFGIRAGSIGSSGDSHIAYCFAAVANYSQFGSFEGNGNADGPFVHLGFAPKLVILKNMDASGTGWIMFDSARDTDNPTEIYLFANTSSAEDSSSVIELDFLSSGFKINDTWNGFNGSGNTILYMAWASNPFQANGGLAR